MRQRKEREQLGSRLDEQLASVAALCSLAPNVPQRDRLIRAIVNRAAVVRLTDVSVTPRQLRRQLALVSADDPEA